MRRAQRPGRSARDDWKVEARDQIGARRSELGDVREDGDQGPHHRRVVAATGSEHASGLTFMRPPKRTCNRFARPALSPSRQAAKARTTRQLMTHRLSGRRVRARPLLEEFASPALGGGRFWRGRAASRWRFVRDLVASTPRFPTASRMQDSRRIAAALRLPCIQACASPGALTARPPRARATAVADGVRRLPPRSRSTKIACILKLGH